MFFVHVHPEMGSGQTSEFTLRTGESTQLRFVHVFPVCPECTPPCRPVITVPARVRSFLTVQGQDMVLETRSPLRAVVTEFTLVMDGWFRIMMDDPKMGFQTSLRRGTEIIALLADERTFIRVSTPDMLPEMTIPLCDVGTVWTFRSTPGGKTRRGGGGGGGA